MGSEDFYKKFTAYVKANRSNEANMVLMRELGRIMINKREDFIYMLKYSGVDVPENISDINLIELFLKNIYINQRIILGTSFLIAENNKMSSFDGEEYTSNICADAVHKSLKNYFFDTSKENMYGSLFEGEETSNFEGDTDNLFYSQDADNFQKRINKPIPKRDTQRELFKKKMSAKHSLIEGVVDVRQKEADALKETEKQKRLKLIIGSSLIGATIIAISVYAIIKYKKG